MTTTTKTDLQPVRLPVASRSPRSRTSVIMTVLGVALLAAGLVAGRIKYHVAGGYSMSAAQVDRECRTVGQLTGQVPHVAVLPARARGDDRLRRADRLRPRPRRARHRLGGLRPPEGCRPGPP